MNKFEIGDVVYDATHRVYGTVYGFVASVTGERLALLHGTHDFTGKPLASCKWDFIASYGTFKCGTEKVNELRKSATKPF